MDHEIEEGFSKIEETLAEKIGDERDRNARIATLEAGHA